MPSQAEERKSKAQKTAKNISRSLKRKRNVDEHETLRKAIEELDPKSEVKDFSDLPLSQSTSSGLEASHFKTLTDIQSKAVPLALKGRDILGAAKTGSGKTLAFLVPVLENLYRQQWTEIDGLGALIISPTRELATQIFQVLRKIGRNHSFSAGLIIGGRSLQEERERLGRMNILVCTPGRILQHMDQTADFDVSHLQMLVLDEADRIMDMGFQRDVDAIVEHVPKQRQTMLFSATQTKKVSDLARLSLRDPEYVAVHEAATTATPTTLQQYVVITPLAEKLNTLFSFIRNNLKAKIIVFMSSGKQVRFVYESFRHMQPGIPLLHLHGRQKQSARHDITSKFSSSKNSCIFATDVVARGLDFPAVDWVIQLDCPEDADTYIHRVGRTARYERAGKAVLFLDPSEEEGMLKRLEQKKVPVQKTKPRQKLQQSIQNQLQDMCFKYPEVKYLGQKAFTSYAKSIYLQRDKEIFKISEYDLEGFATSMGLPGAPKIKFQKGTDAKNLKNALKGVHLSEDDSEEEGEAAPKKGEVRTKYDRMFERRNQDVLSGHYSKMIAEDNLDGDDGLQDADEDNDFLSVKRVVPVDDDSSSDEEDVAAAGPAARVIKGIGKEPIVIDSKRREKMLKSKKQMLKFKEKGTKLVFDDDGNAHQLYELEDEEAFRRRGTAEAQRAKFLEEESARVREADLDDKQLAKQKKREKREKRKAREAAAERAGSDDEAPELVNGDDGHDPMALLASLPMADEDDARPAKRPKKWFEDESGDEKKVAQRKGRVVEADDEPETLEDLEALAAAPCEPRETRLELTASDGAPDTWMAENEMPLRASEDPGDDAPAVHVDDDGHRESILPVCARLAARVNAFLATEASTPLLKAVQEQTRVALGVISTALERYSLDEISLSYNGGKDCLVLLILLLCALASYEKGPLPRALATVYIVSPHPFAEVDAFVDESVLDYRLDLARYALPMKQAFTTYLAEHARVKAILVGTRRTDPHGQRLTHFDETDSGWPRFTRVHPVIDWHYAEIWAFIRHLQIPYCPLYDRGYTSLGGTTDTHPNPALKAAADGPAREGAAQPVFRPAYELTEDHAERLGRDWK